VLGGKLLRFVFWIVGILLDELTLIQFRYACQSFKMFKLKNSNVNHSSWQFVIRYHSNAFLSTPFFTIIISRDWNYCEE